MKKRRRLYRSSAILATSLAALVPKPYAKASQKKEGKEHSPSSLLKPASGGTSAGTTPPGSVPNPAKIVTVPLSQPFSSIIPKPTGTIQAIGPITPLGGTTIGQGKYPWRTGIVTTTFWVGEKAAKNNPVPNDKSSWDVNWAKNYGGTDSPDASDRIGYLPAKFTPGQNPFYIALPYNDMQKGGHKPEASAKVPWFWKDYKGPDKSVLKGRWIAIRRGDRVAYAQWEDTGPFRTDHADYVFGDERPKPNLNKGAGLDVSPAVRDYLEMKSTDITDWKFVDFEEVPRGPWSTHGENNTFVLKDRIDTIRVAELKEAKTLVPIGAKAETRTD